MTDIKKLMEEATPLPWCELDFWEDHGNGVISESDYFLMLTATNALPAVLELIQAVKNISMNCMEDEVNAAVDAADALAKQLGVEA